MSEELNLDKELELQEIETIKGQLNSMGVKYHHNANFKTLKQLRAKALEPKEEEVVAKAETVSKDAAIAEARNKATELVRVSITCRNPAKGQRRGEFFTCGNDVVGHLKAFIPYNCEAAEDVRIPRIFIDMLKDRTYQSTVELSDKERMDSPLMHRTMWLKEFAVVELGN